GRLSHGSEISRHRHRHVAGHHHVVQRLVRNLAQPAKSSQYRRQISQSTSAEKSGSRQDRRPIQPHQYSAFHSDAVQHGGGRTSVLSRGPIGRGTAQPIERFFFDG